MSANNTIKTYRGSCHCAKILYEVDLPEIKGYDDCNCSICFKKGYAWVLPKGDQLRFVTGSKEDLAVYVFGNGDFKHLFCSDCGIPVMGTNSETDPSLFLNARTIEDIDIWSLKANTYDGKSLPPPHKAPAYDGPEPSAGDDKYDSTYYGSCHCGAVKTAVKVNSLNTYNLSKETHKFLECNCKYCIRGSHIWGYLDKEQVAIHGAEHMTYYSFNFRVLRKGFCKHCGVHIVNEMAPMSDDQIKNLSGMPKIMYDLLGNKRNINLRTLDDFDCSKLELLREDGRNVIPSA